MAPGPGTHRKGQLQVEPNSNRSERFLVFHAATLAEVVIPIFALTKQFFPARRILFGTQPFHFRSYFQGGHESFVDGVDGLSGFHAVPDFVNCSRQTLKGRLQFIIRPSSRGQDFCINIRRDSCMTSCHAGRGSGFGGRRLAWSPLCFGRFCRFL